MSLFSDSNKVRHTTYKDQVTTALREAILRGHLEPGEPLVASKISKELGISRGPIREALTQLQQEGLVEHSNHRTPHVTTLDPRDAWEVYTLRGGLEVLAIRLGFSFCSKAELDELVTDLYQIASDMNQLETDEHLPRSIELDLQFHSRICQVGNHRRLMTNHQYLDALVGALFLSIRKNFARSPKHMHEKHRELVRCIEGAVAEGDVTAAEEAIWSHHNQRAEEFLSLVADEKEDT